MAVNVVPFTSQRSGGDLVAGDHCPGPYKVLTVWPCVPCQCLLLLLTVSCCCCQSCLCAGMRWAGLRSSDLPIDGNWVQSSLPLTFPVPVPGQGCARGALADPCLLPSPLSLCRFPGPGSADSATLRVSQPRTNRPDHLLRGGQQLLWLVPAEGPWHWPCHCDLR